MSRMLLARACVRWARPWRIGVCAVTVLGVLALPRTFDPIQAASAPQQASAPAASPISPQRTESYCVGCHNTRQKAQGATPIALDELDVSNVPARRAGEGHPQAARRG